MTDAERRWGTETQHAIENFRISDRTMHPSLIRWLALIKSAAATVNADLGLLDRDIADAIVVAADRIVDGEYPDQFPVDVYQTGSGTSTNMNVNEVVAALTDHLAHPNDHVNMGQSSNDVMPTAMRLAACEMIELRLVPATDALVEALRARAAEFADVVKPGRTHLMDAVPVLLGDEFASWAVQIEEASEVIRSSLVQLARVPLGGTAVGNGLGCHPDFPARVLDLVADRAGLTIRPSSPPDRIARQGGHDAVVAVSGGLNVLATALTKVCNDLRWMSSGPNTGLAEIAIPALQKGSSIMPGKVNPVIPEAVLQVCARVIGNHTTITVAGMQGNFELNVMIPVVADAVLESIGIMTNGCRTLVERCIADVTADVEHARALAARSLPLATALNQDLGYERVEEIVNDARQTGRSVRDAALALGVDPSLVDRRLDLDRIARGAADPDRA
ncbi:MAG: class II fumarate hydratase [Ilumatobacteraceae bacterium]|nr:class II fumarate hydratase [Ilumatobacteraceae bacterium]